MVKLTNAQLVDILSESWTMRSICANIVLAEGNRVLDQIESVLARSEGVIVRAHVEKIVREHGDNKIGAIKAIREFGVAKDYYTAFPGIQWDYSSGYGDNAALGLVNAKKLVESVAKQIGQPY